VQVNKTLVSWLTAAGILVGIVVQVGLWPRIGWTTRMDHDADVEALRAEYVASETLIKDFHDEWKCDEYDEELLRLRESMLDADGAERISIEHQMERLRDKMAALNCSRFDDFG
jgi:hypothetical protein